MNSDYILNFEIPRGDTGPTGPSEIKAYGGAYSNTLSTLVIQDTTSPYYINIDYAMPSLNVTYEEFDNGIITVKQSGVYEITYGCTYRAEDTTYKEIKNCNLSLQVNNVEIPGSVVQDYVQNCLEDGAAVYGSMNNTIVTNLNVDDSITLRFGSTSTGTITFENGGINKMIVLNWSKWNEK